MQTSPSYSNDNEIRPAAQDVSSSTRWLALGAIAGPVLLTLAWIVLGWLRPNYSQLRQQISDLGLGPTAPFMNVAFVLSGLLLLVGVVGIQRRILVDVGHASRALCTVLLALNPLGGVVVGIFTKTALAGHATGVVLAFLTPIVGFLITGLVLRRTVGERAIGSWLVSLASPLTLVLVVIFLQTGAPGAPLAAMGLGGLSERVLIEQIFAWYMVLGWLAFRRP